MKDFDGTPLYTHDDIVYLLVQAKEIGIDLDDPSLNFLTISQLETLVENAKEKMS